MRGEKGGTGGARERPQNDRRDAKGSTLDGGTAKATAADLQREKTPRNGRARARPLGVFPAPKCRQFFDGAEKEKREKKKEKKEKKKEKKREKRKRKKREKREKKREKRKRKRRKK